MKKKFISDHSKLSDLAIKDKKYLWRETAVFGENRGSVDIPLQFHESTVYLFKSTAMQNFSALTLF